MLLKIQRFESFANMQKVNQLFPVFPVLVIWSYLK